jgi:hypothetical protein
MDEENPPAWVFRTRCNWMLHCTNLATGRRHSPGAGHVPICDSCRAWDDADEQKRRRLNACSYTHGGKA